MPNAGNFADLSFVIDSIHNSIRSKNSLPEIFIFVFTDYTAQTRKRLQAVCL